MVLVHRGKVAPVRPGPSPRGTSRAYGRARRRAATLRRILPPSWPGTCTPCGVRGAGARGPLVGTSPARRGKPAGTVAGTRTFP